jgi:hypothetical protein
VAGLTPPHNFRRTRHGPSPGWRTGCQTNCQHCLPISLVTRGAMSPLVAMSAPGTFRKWQAKPAMSAHRGRPDIDLDRAEVRQ